MEQWRW